MTGMQIAVAVTVRTATALDARRCSRRVETFAGLRVLSVAFMTNPPVSWLFRSSGCCWRAAAGCWWLV
ncbi:Uncharacterised protein [Mycobacteroides abscessus subsp. abscessus]|nr:Uncharacterised protein [Mycobacteroides abscessus subsp. abscessus]